MTCSEKSFFFNKKKTSPKRNTFQGQFQPRWLKFGKLTSDFYFSHHSSIIFLKHSGLCNSKGNEQSRRALRVDRLLSYLYRGSYIIGWIWCSKIVFDFKYCDSKEVENFLRPEKTNWVWIFFKYHKFPWAKWSLSYFVSHLLPLSHIADFMGLSP